MPTLHAFVEDIEDRFGWLFSLRQDFSLDLIEGTNEICLPLLLLDWTIDASSSKIATSVLEGVSADNGALEGAALGMSTGADFKTLLASMGEGPGIVGATTNPTIVFDNIHGVDVDLEVPES